MKHSMKTILHLLFIALLLVVPSNSYSTDKLVDLINIDIDKISFMAEAEAVSRILDQKTELLRAHCPAPKASKRVHFNSIVSYNDGSTGLRNDLEEHPVVHAQRFVLQNKCYKTSNGVPLPLPVGDADEKSEENEASRKKIRYKPNQWFGCLAKETQYVVTRKITEPYTIPQSKFFDRHPHVKGAGIISGAASALTALGYFGGTYIKNNIDSSVLSGSRISSLVSKIGFNAVELSKKIDGLDINPKYIAASLGLVCAGVSTLYWLRQPYKKEIVDEIVQGRGGEIWHPDQVKMHRATEQHKTVRDLYSHRIDKMVELKGTSIFSIANYEDDCWRNDTIKAVKKFARNPKDTFELPAVEPTVFNMLNQYLDDPIENASLKERLFGYLHDVMPAVELYRLLKKTFPEATITLIENKILLGDEEESFEERYQDTKNNLSKMTDLELKNSLRGFLLAYEGVRENPRKKQSFLSDPKSKAFFEVASDIKKLLNVEEEIAINEFSIDYCCEHMNDSGAKEMISMLKDMPKKI